VVSVRPAPLLANLPLIQGLDFSKESPLHTIAGVDYSVTNSFDWRSVVGVPSGGAELKSINAIDLSPCLKSVTYVNTAFSSVADNHPLYFYENAAADDDWEVYSNVRLSEYGNPVRIVQSVLNNNFFDSEDQKDLLFIKFFDSNSIIVEKPEENLDFVVVKQKRYKRKQNISTY
jgi:hypothetical protein